MPVGAATVGLNVTATPSSALKNPSPFGPHTRNPVRCTISPIRACNPSPLPPSSANPEEITTACRTPAAAQASRQSGTSLAGSATTARSIAAPIAARSG